MKIAVVKEIKPDEYRVALTPARARELVRRGHEVFVERGNLSRARSSRAVSPPSPTRPWSFREGSSRSWLR
jgi:hypothetical protein